MAASEAKLNSKGLDGALWKKIDAKFDSQDAKNVLVWVQNLAGEDLEIPDTVGPDQFLDILQSGYFLCKMAETIDPDCWKKIKQKKFKAKKKGNAFVFRNQISVFTKAVRLFGMKENDLFTSQDLYSRENPNTVCVCLMQLSAILQNYDGFDGPYMDGGFKASTENKRVFSEEVIRKGRQAVPQWSKGSLAVKGGPQLDGAGIVKTAGNEDWVDKGGVSKWSQGSIAVDSGPQLDGAGILKTAGSEDWRDTGGVSKWAQGSIAVPDNPRVDHIDKNVANRDWQDSGAVPKFSQVKKMDDKKGNFDAHGIIKHA